jgi:hypothetical protein
VNLRGKGKGDGAPTAKAPAFSPIDRSGLLGLLDQVVNTGQSGVLELHEPRGNWVYAFQAGALTHASGGRVRGARQAFDLLWEFQSGEFTFTPGVNPNLAGNLYIDKGRLLDLLRRSQAVLQGPSAPYIAPGQQRPIAPVNRPYMPPNPSQMPPQWQPGVPPQPAPQWPAQGQPGMPPAAPAWGQGYPQAAPGQPYPPAGYPPAPAQPYPAQPYPAGMRPPVPTAPQQPATYPGYPQQAPMPPQAPAPMPQPPFAAPAPPQPPFQMPAQPAAPSRPVTPPSFSVPPMPIPRKQQAVPAYQPPAAAPPATPAPAPAPAGKDDLAALRASLVAQAPQVKPAPSAAWAVRTAEGTVAPPQAANPKGAAKTKDKKKKGDSRLMAGIKVQLIKFLLWACERRYSPDDHWTLKDAFEVSTMELRDQFLGAFSQTLASTKKAKGLEDDDIDDMAAGRMRGRGRRH